MSLQYSMKTSVFFSLILMTTLHQIAATECEFPENLRGNWVSADRGKMTFNISSVFGMKMYIPGIPALDFNCIDQTSTIYFLQAIQFVNIFGRITRFFLCWAILPLHEDAFIYFQGTDFDSALNDHSFGTIDRIPNITEVCNKTKLGVPHTYIMLIREGSVTNGTTRKECPSELRDVFGSVMITSENGSYSCSNNTLDVCSNKERMNFTYQMSNSQCSTLSLTGQYTCLHHVVSNETTYVSLWNEDPDPSIQFTCLAFRKFTDSINATESPGFCSESTTYADLGFYENAPSAGRFLEITGASGSCISMVNGTTCIFQSQLQGVWISSKNDVFRINTTVLKGYSSTAPGHKTLELECLDKINNKYLLRAAQQTVAFGQTIYIFLCLDIRQIDSDFVYYVGTEYENYLNDDLYGTVNDTATLQEVCNREEPYDGGSAIMLLKNVFSMGLQYGVPCPQNIRSIYNSVSVVQGNDIIQCQRSSLDICYNESVLNFSINSTCGPVIPTIAEFVCLFHVQDELRTYVYMYTEDRNEISLQSSIVCAEFQEDVDEIAISIYEEYCNDLKPTTAILNMTIGSKVSCPKDNEGTTNTTGEKPPQPDKDKAFSVYSIVIGVIFLSAAIVVIIIIIISRQKICFQCRLKPQGSETPQQFSDLNQERY